MNGVKVHIWSRIRNTGRNLSINLEEHWMNKEKNGYINRYSCADGEKPSMAEKIHKMIHIWTIYSINLWYLLEREPMGKFLL